MHSQNRHNVLKNIILDLGGVLFDLDYQLTIDAFRKLGVKDPTAMFTQSNQTKEFDLFEEGKIIRQKGGTALIVFPKPELERNS